MNTLIHIGRIALATALIAPGLALAEQETAGKLEFQMNCAGCHGMDGRGNGPFLDFLKQAPADLTMISKTNGGSFPFQKVYRWIEDPNSTRAHGTQEMPIWGARYSNETIRKYGHYDTEHPGSAQARILSLVYYLGTVQQ